MYRQIWVDPKHTPFQRILFRNKEGDIRDFELKTVTFGVNCAPFLAIRVLQQLAEDIQVPFPNASRIIQQHMYVDDVLAGANSVNEAQSSIREMQAAPSASGFPLRKWTSNNKSVLKDVPAEHLLHSEFLDIDAESTAKTLGIRWRAKSDEFYFVPPDIVVEPFYTKREVLSQIARLFDPAGWLAPFIIRSKMFMQEIWLQNLGWDDKLPTEMSQRWQSFLDEYSDLNQIRVPRWIWYQPEEIIEHHGFCDASQRAYGAAIYIRVEMGQKILTRLLTAKTRVGYVCVFVCFSTKAIHLEPTSDLTTEKFLAAFARFVARRGCPQRVHSDNGKTFVGAATLISRDFLQAIKESVTDAYSHQGLVWRFIPPGAPHMGGLWEAGVKSFQTLFLKSTSVRKYTFEELATLLAKIEACLNSRPLSPMSEDPSDLLALTPGHFLIGGPLLSTAEPEIKGEAKSIINRWQHLKAQHQQFSERWKEEYLKELHKRSKWQFPTRNLQADDMVVVKEDNLPPNEWRLGRIVSAFPGADDRIRVVEIRTSRGTIKRPVHKVILLPMEDKESSVPRD
nr:uncharacterized protein LOC120284346 isoform X2 [Drosophila simulans]